MKQTLFLKITLSVASIASMLGMSSLIAQPVFAADAALNCAILPQNICDSAKTGGSDTKKTGVFILLIWVLNIMTAGVGIAAVGALIYAGVLYASAGGGSEQIVKSKKIITDTVIGIIAYALMFLVINWLVPGGVIG
jgi:hypothetical protein